MGRVRPHSAPRIGAAHCQPHGRARMGPRPGRGISHRADSHYPPSLHWRRSPATTAPCLRIETTWISSVNHARQRRRMLLCLLLVYASSRTELNWTGLTLGEFLGGRPQRDWASRVERPSLVPSAQSSVRIHLRLLPLRLGRSQTRAGSSSSSSTRWRNANGRFHSCSPPDDLHTSAFIRKLTASFPPPAAMPVSRMCGVARF